MQIFSASMEIQGEAALSVGDLNRHIAHLLEADPILGDIAVRGEISNFKRHGSGHAYFSLKDENAQIRCCLWRRNVSNLRFLPNDGDRVIAYGKVEFYPARGETSFIVESLHFAGQGAQFEAFERLKAALAADGLFDESRKKTLPARPRRIGLITSGTGAAPRDVLSVLARRWPLGEVILIPTLVQGANAPADIIRALSWAEALEDLDVVIVARGGGSAEDLWCFNDEALCRYAAEFPIPLISAVGHEIDFTLFDFVADVRAATPTAAGEIVAPDIRELYGEVFDLRRRLKSSVEAGVLLARARLENLRNNRVLTHPHERLKSERETLARLNQRLKSAPECAIEIERQKLAALKLQLRALDPARVLERGYAILADENGKVFSSAKNARHHQLLTAQLHDGKLQLRVEPSSNQKS
jgi:exodeoxyribonuclease VII large subunit